MSDTPDKSEVKEKAQNRADKTREKRASDIISESFHLLRHSPPTTFLIYYLGTLPFILSLLYFWSEMSSHSDERLLLPGAILMSLFFVWMKFWQSIYALKLKEQLFDNSDLTRYSPSFYIQLAMRQTAHHSLGLFIIPLAAIATLPLAWVYAYYQNLTVIAEGREDSLASLAAEEAKKSPYQNHIILSFFSVFVLFVFLNIASAIFLIPQLLKILFAFESPFTLNPYSLLSTTFLASCAAITYVCVDPILKCVYVLRCYYGVSLKSGDDLRRELRHVTRIRGRAALSILVVAIALSMFPYSAHAESNEGARHTPLSQNASVDPLSLENSIRETLRERKYRWRMPAKKNELMTRDSHNWFESLMLGTAEMIKDFLSFLGDMVGAFFEWLIDWISPERHDIGENSQSPLNWSEGVRLLSFVFLALLVCLLVITIKRIIERNRKPEELVEATPMNTKVDLNSEEVDAQSLHSDEWLDLAHEMARRKDWRLAIRAYYLATLSHLHRRRLLSTHPGKSNLEYAKELSRRAHQLPEIGAGFGRIAATFEGCWYGSDIVDEHSEKTMENFIREIMSSKPEEAEA